MINTSSQHPHAPLRQYFQRLGLDSDIADVYLALHAYGPQNMLQLSRNSGVERTKLYRLVEVLVSHHLVEKQTEYKKTVILAAPINNLQILLSQREQELHDLQADLRQLHHLLSQNSIASPATRVQMYRGSEGLKQMFWNQSKATTATLAIMYENMQNRTKLAFFERWVRRCNERNLQFRGIIGDYFVKTQQDWYRQHSNERLNNWAARYAPPHIFPITHSNITYDNVVSYFNWKDGEVFGIEIYNPEIAAAQQRFFKLLWEKSIPVDDLKGLPAAVAAGVVK